MTGSQYNPPRSRLLSPRYIAAKVRKDGLVWAYNRLLEHVRWRLGLGAKFSPYRFEDTQLGVEPPREVLYAFYDLAMSPPTFDVVDFLLLAELERRETGCAALHVVIVPGRNQGFREGDAPYDLDSKHWRLRNILVPCCWLIPMCQHVTVCVSREEAQEIQGVLAKRVFPKGYTVRVPIERHMYSHVVAATSSGAVLPSLQATPQAKAFMKEWLQLRAGDRRVITMTLRECSYQPERNSRLEDSVRFARSLDPTAYCPVFVRDIETAVKPPPAELAGLLVCDAAVWSVELRAALYELSYLNMGVNNGHCILFMLNQRSRYLLFKMITPSVGVTTERFLRHIGIPPGSQLPGATPFQRIVWNDDELHVMKEAFSDMSKLFQRQESASVVV